MIFRIYCLGFSFEDWVIVDKSYSLWVIIKEKISRHTGILKTTILNTNEVLKLKSQAVIKIIYYFIKL